MAEGSVDTVGLTQEYAFQKNTHTATKCFTIHELRGSWPPKGHSYNSKFNCWDVKKVALIVCMCLRTCLFGGCLRVCVCVCVCLFVCLFGSLCACLFVCLVVGWLVESLGGVLVCLPICLCVYVRVCLFVCLFLCLRMFAYKCVLEP